MPRSFTMCSVWTVRITSDYFAF